VGAGRRGRKASRRAVATAASAMEREGGGRHLAGLGWERQCGWMGREMERRRCICRRKEMGSSHRGAVIFARMGKMNAGTRGRVSNSARCQNILDFGGTILEHQLLGLFVWHAESPRSELAASRIVIATAFSDFRFYVQRRPAK
jgi:hypothetical protein